MKKKIFARIVLLVGMSVCLFADTMTNERPKNSRAQLPARKKAPLNKRQKTSLEQPKMPVQQQPLPAPERRTVDKVIAIIYYSEGSELILQSDLRPDLTDTVPTLKDVILKKLILIDAKKMKIPVSGAEVDRHIARVQEQLKMTRADLIEFFKERGYSLEEARKELEKNLLIETAIGQRVKAYVPESEIEQYCKDNPIIHYDVCQAFIPLEYGSKAIHRALIDSDIESGAIAKKLDWGTVLTLKDSDISSEKAFIKELAPGAVARVQETDQGTTVLKMVARRETPFEERKHEIQAQLGRERYMKGLKDYTEGLLAQKKDMRVRYIDSRAQHQAQAPS